MNVEHEEEESTRGEEANGALGEQLHRGHRGTAGSVSHNPVLLENAVQGETSGVTAVQRQARAGDSRIFRMRVLACQCPWELSSHMLRFLLLQDP